MIRKLFLAAVVVTAATVSSLGQGCTNLYGWISVTGGVPSGWNPSYAADMIVRLDIQHPEFGWLEYTSDNTDAGGLYMFPSQYSGTYRIRPVSYSSPYDGFFDKKPQVVTVDCSVSSIQKDFVFDFHWY